MPALYAPLAGAGRPFATEDAAIIDRGACELEAYAAYAATHSEPSERGGSAQIACGIGFNTQLAVVGQHFTSRDTHRTIVGASGKTALRPQTDAQAGVTIAYSIKAQRLPEISLRREESAVSLVASVPYGRTLVHGNVGFIRTESDRHNAGTYAVLIERLGETALDVGLEVFGETRSTPWLGTGARYAVVPQRLFLDASAAFQPGEARGRQFTVGLKYTF